MITYVVLRIGYLYVSITHLLLSMNITWYYEIEYLEQ